MRRVFILAAGAGQRLRPLTNALPKALLRIGDQSILKHQIDALTESGIRPEEVVIVTGHEHSELEKVAKELGVSTLFNPHFDSANNIVSLQRACEAFPIDHLSEMIIINCDVWAHRKIFLDLIEGSEDASVVVDVGDSPDREAMKVTARDGRVLAFGKELSGGLVAGEYIGLSRFRSKPLEALVEAVDRLIAERRINEWYESALSDLAARVPIHMVPTNGLPWIEIDTHDDFQRAQFLLEKAVP